MRAHVRNTLMYRLYEDVAYLASFAPSNPADVARLSAASRLMIETARHLQLAILAINYNEEIEAAEHLSNMEQIMGKTR
jgi:hypothetical protein